MNVLRAILFMMFVDIPFSFGVKHILEPFAWPVLAVDVIRFLLLVFVNMQISFRWSY